MNLEPGTRLGSYEILGLLGTGGMGEVYRARDGKLDRDVAIKVLPRRLAEDATALGRFEREAKAVAALAHPNILAIYDFGTDAGVTYAAMELLEGETLRERLAGGPLPPRKAVELAKQIAAAIGAAHGRGIVHRDLKPENVFVSGDGRAKVLDFGLAGDAAGVAGADDETVGSTHTSLTAPGTVMGTVGYMSPEQVRAQPTDHRSDIFSFGSVFYEMLTGRKAFASETSAETMTAILREEPPEPESIVSAVPPALARVVRRCLEKSPDERFQSAQDLAFAIENSSSALSGEQSGVGKVAPAPPAARRVGWLPALLLAIVALAVGFGLASWLRPAVDEPTHVQVRTLTFSGSDSEPTVSPDGRILAFTSRRDGRSRIWVKQLATGGEEPLTDGKDVKPRFSPDGSTLLFLRDEGKVGSVYRQSMIGGQVRKLVEDVVDACWSPDGSRIAFLRTQSESGSIVSEIGIADAQEGTETILLEAPRGMYGIQWSPDGRRLATVEASITGNNPDYRLILVDAGSGEVERRRLSSGNPISGPIWTSDGGLVLAESSSLLGDQGDTVARLLRYDPDTGRVRTLFHTEHIFPLQGVRADFTQIEIVAAGTLVFHSTRARQNLREVILGGPGERPVERVLTRGEGRDRQPVYSKDGKQVLFSSNRSGNLDLWSIDLEDGTLRQLTDDAAQDWDPVLTPDGRQMLWSSDRGGHLEIWIANSDGSGARQLTQDGLDAENPTVTPDGEWVVYWSANPGKLGVWKIRIDGTEESRVAAGAFLQPELSPDGRHAAFISMELDLLRTKIFVVDIEAAEIVPFEIEVPTPLQATNIILGRVRWLPDGSGLVYIGMDDKGRTGLYAQDFVPGGDTTSTRRPLAGFSSHYTTESFGISSDGRRITLATLEETTQLKLAEGVPDIPGR